MKNQYSRHFVSYTRLNPAPFGYDKGGGTFIFISLISFVLVKRFYDRYAVWLPNYMAASRDIIHLAVNY